jgi:membrane protein
MQTLKNAVLDFIEDDALTLAAALAFYSALSIAPIVLLLVWAGAFLGEGTKNQLTGQARQIAGPAAGDAIETVIENAQERPDLRSIAGAVSIISVIVAATGVFAQLQFSMNRIWDVQPKPKSGAISSWLKKRLVSLLMILVIGALLVVSLGLGAVLSAAAAAGSSLVASKTLVPALLNAAISVVIFTLFFAAIYKFLPDTQISWRATWAGAVLTAILFTIGRWLVGLYLAHSTTGSAYGAAGSLLVLLVWIYYSSLILFFGAEITQVWARRRGLATAPPKRHGIARQATA